MEEEEHYRILVIDDDEDDYFIMRRLLARIQYSKYESEWADTFDKGLEKAVEGGFDVILLDYRLGNHNGFELLQETARLGCRVPIIVLTGQGDRDVDVRAMKMGAVDYLVKEELNMSILERVIRYAVERTRANERIRDLMAEVLTAQEEERHRIASELHDSIGGKLTVIKFGVEKLLMGLPQENAAEGFSAKDVLETIKETMQETRRISQNLQPLELEALGLLKTISGLCREFKRLGTGVYIKQEIDVTEDDIPENLKITIYRFCQEALNNIAKHSEATDVRLWLANHHGRIEIGIEDNGRGFDPEFSNGSDKKGFGLNNMRQRVELSKGVMDIWSAPDNGTVIKAWWPSAAALSRT
jgi:signal transduction histidine kinase